MSTMENTQSEQHADIIQGPNVAADDDDGHGCGGGGGGGCDDGENPAEMIQRELCLLSLVESAEIKLRRQQERLIELERVKRAGQMRASQPSETTTPVDDSGDQKEAIHGIVLAASCAEQAARASRLKLAASMGWQLKSPAFVTLNGPEFDREQAEPTLDVASQATTKRQQQLALGLGLGLEPRQEAIETSGQQQLHDGAPRRRLVAEMTNRASEHEAQEEEQQQDRQQQQRPLAELLPPMNEPPRRLEPEPILSNAANELSLFDAARRRASLRLEPATTTTTKMAALERDKDKIDGPKCERRRSLMVAAAAEPRPGPGPAKAGEHTKLNHQRHNYNHHHQQQQQGQHALMLQKSDQQQQQNDRTSARSGDCREGQRPPPPPPPTSFSAQSTNDGQRRGSLALTPAGGCESSHWQNSKHPERAHYDMNDCYVVGGAGGAGGGEGQRLQEESERAHLEGGSRRRSINSQQVDDERAGGPTPTNDLVRTLLERDRQAFGLPASGPGLHQQQHQQQHHHQRRRSSQVNNNETIEMKSDKAQSHDGSDDDESNFDKSRGRRAAQVHHDEAETTTSTSATTTKATSTRALAAGLYYQTLRTSASSPSNLSAATPTPDRGYCCKSNGCCAAADGCGQQRGAAASKQQRPQLACASNEANSRLLLASFLRGKQEQHGPELNKLKEWQQQQQQVMARCRDQIDAHNKNASHPGKRHSIINLLTHTGHRTQARRSFAAFGMGVLNSSNSGHSAGRHKPGRRLTSGGELLSAHLGIRNHESQQQPMQGSVQSLDGPCAQQQQQQPPQYDPLIPESGFKIVVMGTSGSGKTSIIQRFLYGTFSARHLPTVEDTYFIEFPYKKNLINISVSDTSGTYQFPAMRKLAINSGDAFILVYSVDDPKSFDCLEQLRQTILEEREQAYLESAVAACPSDSSSSSTSSLAPHAAASGTTTMMSSLTSTVMNQHHQHHHHHNQLQPAHDMSPGRHWSLASLFSHQHHHSSIGSSICSSSSCSSAENSRRSSISAAEAALRTRRTRKPPMVIVANKHDLPKDKHLINSDEIEALAVIDWNNGFVRASAALNWNIEEIFQQVLTQARQPPTLSEAIVSKRRKSLPPKLPHT